MASYLTSSIGVLFAFYAFVWQNSKQSLAGRPNEENFKKVEVGMREEEVYAILGAGTRLEHCAYVDPPNPQVAFSAEWWDTQWRYVVYFDKDRRVTYTAMVAYHCSRCDRASPCRRFGDSQGERVCRAVAR